MHRPITGPLTRSLSGGVTGVGGGGYFRYAISQSLVVIGDSRTEMGIKQFYTASSADWKGLDVPTAFTSVGITSTATPGTLEYRASDQNLRWTAPGDVAGPWTPSYAGIIRCESGTADKFIDLRMATVSGLPVTDQTVSVTFAGDLRLGWWARGWWKRALDYLRWVNADPKITGIGGNTSADVLEQLDYIATQGSGPGVDLILLGTNDVGGRVATATTQANLQTILDARRALGRTLVIVGDHARYDTGTTPLDSGQQAAHAALNTFLSNYATANGCIFVDTFALTYDSGFIDRRPAAGMLVDNVHLSDKGAQIIGKAVADAIVARTGYGLQRSWTANALSIGDFSGTGGTASTGVTGTVATGWLVVRASGDATVTASVVPRSDGITGQWQRVVMSGALAGRVDVRPVADPSLATMGLSAGDLVHLELEVNLTSATGLTNIQPFLQFSGATSPSLVSPSAKQGTGVAVLMPGHVILRTPVFRMPSAATGMQLRIWVEHDANVSADFLVGAAGIVKH